MTHVRWGIIGPGEIAHNFAQGIVESDNAVLAAIASTNAERRQSFGDQFDVPNDARFASYAELMASDAVEAIYVATPHPFHAQIAVDAMRAGKNVLVEKPAGLIAAEIAELADVAAQCGVLFAEGVMYRYHPQIARVIEVIRSGEIGDVRHIEASFGFAAGYDPASRLFDPQLAGGAILDVGIYPVSFARLIAGAAVGLPFADPVQVSGSGTLCDSGVDETAFATLLFEGGITASVATAVTMNMDNTAKIVGSKGSIFLADPWVPGRNTGPSDAVVTIEAKGVSRDETLADPRILFAHEVAGVSDAILKGQVQVSSPGPEWQDSIGTMHVLDTWRQQAGYTLPVETPEGIRKLHNLIPAGLPKMETIAVEGLEAPLAKLILGCDNRDTLAEGALVWDAWWDAGGRAFDTGYVYGGGRHEVILGKWLAATGTASEAQIIVKGAHSPYCFPAAIAAELEISLDRLQIDHAPIYIMHRDNTDVPVGEFMQALQALKQAGRVGAIGASNWTVERFAEANKYAQDNGLTPFSFLNNNLSLATLENISWPGCRSANTPEALAYLRDTKTAHISWSSQARGYFLNAGEGTDLPAGTAPEEFFGSTGNQERRARAAKLGHERGVSAHSIATAWVLEQSFPSAAVIGPRTAGQIVSTLECLTVRLSEAEVKWLNLESDER